VVGGSFGWVSIFSSFEARSALFHSPPGDTRPLSMLIVFLWSSRCLLRPGCSAVIGAWKGCSSHFGRAYGHVSCHSRAGWFPRGFLALGGCWVGPEAARVLHAPSPVGISSVSSSCFGCFFCFYRMYLTVLFWV
jgi:hypothetical protein